jgi:hypothetical protein
VGGCIAAALKGIDFYMDSRKRAAEKQSRYDDQRDKFMSAVLDRLERVNQELDDEKREADEYKKKYWDTLEQRFNDLRGGKGGGGKKT